MKKIIRIFSSMLLFALIAGVIYLNVKDGEINKKYEDKKNTNTAHADWVNHYENFDSLIKNADIVIQGEKIDSYAEQRIDMIFTKEVIEINKVYQGDIAIGDKIEILQTGGTLNGIETAPFEEAPLLEDGSKYLLFLQKTPEEHYLILGGYQGVGLIEGNQVKFNSENIKISNELKKQDIYSIERLLTDNE